MNPSYMTNKPILIRTVLTDPGKTNEAMTQKKRRSIWQMLESRTTIHDCQLLPSSVDASQKHADNFSSRRCTTPESHLRLAAKVCAL